jgi:hypothetical protein
VRSHIHIFKAVHFLIDRGVKAQRKWKVVVGFVAKAPGLSWWAAVEKVLRGACD